MFINSLSEFRHNNLLDIKTYNNIHYNSYRSSDNINRNSINNRHVKISNIKNNTRKKLYNSTKICNSKLRYSKYYNDYDITKYSVIINQGFCFNKMSDTRFILGEYTTDNINDVFNETYRRLLREYIP